MSYLDRISGRNVVVACLVCSALLAFDILIRYKDTAPLKATIKSYVNPGGKQQQQQQQSVQTELTISPKTSNPSNCADLPQVQSQLAAVSKLLNSALLYKAMKECEIKEAKHESQSGGYCMKGDLVKQHIHDEPMAKFLSSFFKGKSVGSFGDGSGKYQTLIKGMNEVTSYDSYDGNPYSNESSNGLVGFLDLSVPQHWLPKYDWILTLEVAEHIPAPFEQIFLDNVARYAKEGIILSWAVPGQGGRSHVNNKPDTYVREQLLKRGFKRDEEASKEIKATATFSWFKRNTNIYRREGPMC